MSQNVISPHNVPFDPKSIQDNAIGAFVTGGVALGRKIQSIIKEGKKTTQAQAREKAGVWYQMLNTLVKNNSMTGEQLAKMYIGKLPFRQKKTKERFMHNNIIGKSRTSIVNHLVQKINEELTKATPPLPTMTKVELLGGMGGQVVKQTLGITLRKLSPIAPKTTIVSPAYDVLFPLIPTMKKGLRAKGIPPSNDIRVLSSQFYNEIVRKNAANNFGGSNDLPEVHYFDYHTDNADDAANAIISGIISYINALRAKKEQGAELTQLQNIVVGGTEKVEYEVTKQVKAGAAKKLGEKILFDNKWMWVIGGIVAFMLVLAIIMKK